MLKLHGFMYSPPSRACYAFLKMQSIPFEFVSVDAWKQENDAEEFRQLNPSGTIPVLSDPTCEKGNIVLTQSHTILRYISREHANYAWFAEDSAGEAAINAQLDWQLLRLRPSIAQLLRFDRIRGSSLVEPPSVSVQSLVGKNDGESHQHALDTALRLMEDQLQRQRFLSSDIPSIADLSAGCEIEQVALEHASVLTKYEGVKEWLRFLRAIPAFAEVHEDLPKQHETIVSSTEKGSLLSRLRTGAIDS